MENKFNERERDRAAEKKPFFLVPETYRSAPTFSHRLEGSDKCEGSAETIPLSRDS